tara:strand:- start:5740 stop:6207 length:468 start_codon:yes stop_codon:yes gene_type:complete
MTDKDIIIPLPENNETVLEGFIPYVMYRITNRLNMDLQNDLRPLKINVSRWRVLAALNARDGRSMGELCHYTMMEQSSISRVVDKMVEEGLVVRRVQEQDNRYILVYLTPKGRETFHLVYPKAYTRQDEALKGFSEEERQQLLAYLRRIEENINI